MVRVEDLPLLLGVVVVHRREPERRLERHGGGSGGGRGGHRGISAGRYLQNISNILVKYLGNI